jgi:Asp-tRNA(Asn)/Glu-tRNA(Gln) amidotransferase A subunit family amidase
MAPTMGSPLSLNMISATEVVHGIQAQAFTCEDIAQACLERIRRRESVVKAWSFIDANTVLNEARALDAKSKPGPLHGVPIGVKDIIETVDMPTQMGSPIYKGYQSRKDASCVAILRAAGALILGKTVTCEFAGVTAGPTTNPHDSTRTPGGSSSGSAAAVADYMVAVALATQTGGSIQRPSSYCGVVGYKPSYGLINTEGVKSAAQTLDTLGLMARSVEDIELTARALTNAARVKWLNPQTRVRIGVCRTYNWTDAEDATQRAIEEASHRLAKAGFAVLSRDLAPPFKDLLRTREIINDFERAHVLAHEWNTHPEQISVGLAKSIANGRSITQDRYCEALQSVERYRRMLGDVFADVDVLLTPAANGEAPPGLQYTGDHRFQSIWTQLRTPTITLPTYAGPNGMPVSIQLVGPEFTDTQLLAVAELIFKTLGRGPTVQV